MRTGRKNNQGPVPGLKRCFLKRYHQSKVRTSAKRIDPISPEPRQAGAETAYASHGDAEVGTVHLANGRLPRDYVDATVKLPTSWSEDEPPPVPVLLSFRKLMEEQRPTASSHYAPESPKQGDCAGRLQDLRAQSVDASSSLAQIGRRDHLSECIRSMEGRLARQGLLAAPGSILGRRRKRKIGKLSEAELYYDADDDFIDDEDLEEVNAYDEQRTEAAACAEKNGKDQTALCSHPSKHSQPASAIQTIGSQGISNTPSGLPTAPQLDLTAFRLTGPDVSGTSAEEESDADADDREAEELGEQLLELTRDGCNWRDRLTNLAEELTWVNVMGPTEARGTDAADTSARTSLKKDGCPQVKVEATSPSAHRRKIVIAGVAAGDIPTCEDAIKVPVNASEEFSVDSVDGHLSRLHDLKNRLSKCCEAIESASFAMLDSTSFREALVSELRLLWNELPGLLRPHQERKGRWQLKSFEIACGIEVDADDAAMFGWAMAEEIAWACFLWCLIRDACKAKPLKRSAFVRRWLEAARDVQRDLVTNAETSALELARGLSLSTASSTVSGSTETEPSKQSVKAGSEVLQEYAEVIQRLQSCYARRKFWDEQRRASRLRVLRQVETQAAALYITTKLNTLTSKPIVLKDVLPFLGDVADSKAKKKYYVSKVVPVILPVPIFLHFFNEQIECRLLKVLSVDKQEVEYAQSSTVQTFSSLSEAARALAQRFLPKDQLTKMAHTMQERHWGWAMFKIPRAREEILRPLSWVLRIATKTGDAPFQNPPTAIACPRIDINTFNAMELPDTVYKKALARKTLAQNLAQNLAKNDWVLYKDVDGVFGLPGKNYNAKVASLNYSIENGDVPSKVNLVWPSGGIQPNVDVAKLQPPYLWAQGERVQVNDRGRWREGVVLEASDPNLPSNDAVFEVQFDDMRKGQFGLAKLRQSYKPGASGSQRKQGKGGQDGASGRGRGSGQSGAGGQGRASVSSAASRASVPQAAVSGSNGNEPFQLKQKVRFLQNSKWLSGTITALGAKVTIKTFHPRKGDITISCDREHVMAFDGGSRPRVDDLATVTPCGRSSVAGSVKSSGFISVDDSD